VNSNMNKATEIITTMSRKRLRVTRLHSRAALPLGAPFPRPRRRSNASARRAVYEEQTCRPRLPVYLARPDLATSRWTIATRL